MSEVVGFELLRALYPDRRIDIFLHRRGVLLRRRPATPEQIYEHFAAQGDFRILPDMPVPEGARVVKETKDYKKIEFPELTDIKRQAAVYELLGKHLVVPMGAAGMAGWGTKALIAKVFPKAATKKGWKVLAEAGPPVAAGAAGGGAYGFLTEGSIDRAVDEAARWSAANVALGAVIRGVGVIRARGMAKKALEAKRKELKELFIKERALQVETMGELRKRADRIIAAHKYRELVGVKPEVAPPKDIEAAKALTERLRRDMTIAYRIRRPEVTPKELPKPIDVELKIPEVMPKEIRVVKKVKKAVKRRVRER